jgi:hypothetical protein
MEKQKLDDLTAEAIREDQRRMVLESLRMGWLSNFDERQRRLIANARQYASGDPAGLPGHQLILIIAKMADLLDESNV